MSKFKVGDKVRKINGAPFSNDELVGTVSLIEGSNCVWLVETETYIHKDCIETIEDTIKYHKHHDLIIQWAKGAEIEYYLGRNSDMWALTKNPNWYNDSKYRIKTPTPKTDKERIAELEDRVKELESK